jgi:hypothetical protein
MPVVFITIILGGYIMLFGIMLCVGVMVVPPICVFAKSKDTIHDIVIYVGTKN